MNHGETGMPVCTALLTRVTIPCQSNIFLRIKRILLNSPDRKKLGRSVFWCLRGSRIPETKKPRFSAEPYLQVGNLFCDFTSRIVSREWKDFKNGNASFVFSCYPVRQFISFLVFLQLYSDAVKKSFGDNRQYILCNG